MDTGPAFFIKRILLLMIITLTAVAIHASDFDMGGDIIVDGNDLDWNFQNCYVTMDHTGNVPRHIDIKRFSWDSDDKYLYFVVNFAGYTRGLSNYEYILNIDTDFNDTADLFISATSKGSGEIGYAGQYGDVERTEPVTRASGIKAVVGNVVEYRVPLELVGKQCQVFFGVWNITEHEMQESTVWQAITPGVPFIKQGMDLSVALKHLSGKKYKSGEKLKIDGEIKDWGGVKFSKLADNTAFYFQDDDYFYLLLNKGNYSDSEDLVYYFNVDTNNNYKRNFLIGAIHEQSGYYLKRGKSTSMDEIEGMNSAIGSFVEYRIPLEYFTEKEFLASTGIYNKSNDSYYYYTSWKGYSLSKLKSTTEEYVKADDKKDKTKKNKDKDTVIKQKDKKSGIAELLAAVTDPKMRVKLEQFLAKGVENLLSLFGVAPTKIADHSKSYLNVPYVYGKSNYSGTDCSGLIYASFNKFKIELPRGANAQSRTGTIIADKDDLKKGDLVFFTNTYRTSSFITHVGIYMGENKFINANSYYSKVVIDDLTSKYWRDKFIFGTRGQ